MFDIDTGSRVELTLNKPFVEAHGLTARHPKGVVAVDGWGVGGPSRSYVTRGDWFDLGPVRIDGLVASLRHPGEGRVLRPQLPGQRRLGPPEALRGHLRLRPPGDVPEAAGAAAARRRRVRPRRASGSTCRRPASRSWTSPPAARRPASGLKVGDEITAVDGVAGRQGRPAGAAQAPARRAGGHAGEARRAGRRPVAGSDADAEGPDLIWMPIRA